MAKWQYDPKRKAYIREDGRPLSSDTLTMVRDAYLDDAERLIDDYANNLESGAWSISQFEEAMRTRLKRAYISEYVLGRGGVEQMTQSDWGRIGNMLRNQYGFLRSYLDDLANGNETRGTAANRARNFLGSARQAFSRGRGRSWGMDLPYHPADGGTPCVIDSTLVYSPSVEIAYRRFYEGSIMVLDFSNGQQLTITPNHPVLTDKGWVKAGLLCEGDNVVANIGVYPDPWQEHDPERAPTAIGKVFGSLLANGCVWSEGSGVDFHGDGMDGKIDVVFADGFLRDDSYASFAKHAQYEQFSLPGQGSGSLAPECLAMQLVVSGSVDPTSGVGVRGEERTLIGSHFSHADHHGLAAVRGFDSRLSESVEDDSPGAPQRPSYSIDAFPFVEQRDHVLHADVRALRELFTSGLDTRRTQPSSHRGAIHTNRLGDGIDALPGSVTFHQIVSVHVDSFSGHVYNLQTKEGIYHANGIVVHNCHGNCRCHWSIEEDEVEWRAYWKVGGLDPCTGCLARASESAPYVQRKPVTEE